mgnify:CR=1 FL=1
MKKSKRKLEGKSISYSGEKIYGEHIIRCPKCDVHMEKIGRKSYIVDNCPKCGGIFLDKREIENINKQGFFSYVMEYFRR